MRRVFRRRTALGNPLVFGENRLTLITPTLFRLEFARDGKFIDDPTYFAYDRGSLLPASEFRVREVGGNRYEITTSALRIVYEHDGFPFGLHNFAAYYKLNGKEKKFTNPLHFPQQPRRPGRDARPCYR